jgi:hypothetical protein
MAIAASGAVSFSDLRTEFVGGSSAISMSDLYRGGSNILTKAGDNPAVNMAASVPTSGTIDVQDFYSTAKAFKNTVSSSTTNVDANTLFGDDYDVNYPKIIDINSGVTIGGSGDEAIDIPSGLASTLTINNAGTVIGFGGASAGAAGGSAINCASSGVTINNTGQISGGGGAGNVGGQGGNGSYSQTTGPSYTSSYHTWWYIDNFSRVRVYWGGSAQGNILSYTGSVTTVSHGGYTYTKGTYVQSVSCGNDDNCGTYRISRTGSVSTSGGAGGSFGVGAGYNQSATNGGNGAAGGTSAGAGGAGSNGAALGTAASNSTAGGNGNVSNGAAANAGGAAGAAVSGTSITMNNTGTLHGVVA